MVSAPKVYGSFGLNGEQQRTLAALSGFEINMMIAAVESDGAPCGRRIGHTLAKLREAGFVTIKANGGKTAVVEVTADGLRAIVSKQWCPPQQGSSGENRTSRRKVPDEVEA